jgi:hypothetical protein
MSAIYTAPSGTAGAIAPITQAITFPDSALIKINKNILIPAFDQASSTEYLAQHGIFFRSGFSPADGANESDRRNLSITTGRGSSNLGDALDINAFHHLSIFTGGAERVRVDSVGVLAMTNANGERIRLYDSGGINHAFGVESNCMWQQVSANSVHRWYCGVAPDNGASAAMTLWPGGALVLQGGLQMQGAGTFTFNAQYSGGWKYLGPATAPALVLYSDTANQMFRMMVAPNGAAGAAISFPEIMQLWNGGVTIFGRFCIPTTPTSASGLPSGSVWRDAAAGNVLKIVP